MAAHRKDVNLQVSDVRDFFEGICIPTSLSCEKLWTTEKIIDQSPTRVAPKLYISYVSAQDCRFLCLNERQFTCTAFSYDRSRRACSLFNQNRHSGLLSLTFTRGVDFVENQCAARIVSCRYLPHEPDATLSSVVKSFAVASLTHCQAACDKEMSFTCRSFTFADPGVGRYTCLLSGDNRASSRQGAMRYSPGNYYFGKECVPV